MSPRRRGHDHAPTGGDGRLADWPFERLNGWWADNAPPGLDDAAWRVARWNEEARRQLEADRGRWLARTGRLDDLERRLLLGGTYCPYGIERSCPEPYRALASELLALDAGSTRKRNRP